MKNTDAILKYIARFVDLADHEKELYLSKVRFKKYLKGQFVLQAGELCKYESYVLAGCLKVFHVDPEGQEHIVMFALEDWWTADLGSFLYQTPSDYNIQCLENCELAQFTHEDLEELYAKIPKLERFSRIIMQKAYIAAQKRLLNNLTLTAKERYLWFRKQYPHIDQRVPQYLIASYLGMTPEFLSKVRSQIMHEQ
jgi:CRP-like cAMP-binding protein